MKAVRTLRSSLICTLLCGLPLSGNAAEFVLQLPLGAKATYSQVETTLPALVPTGPFKDGKIPKVEAPKNIQRTVWVMGGESTVSQVQAGILGQLETAGYEPLLFCVAKECGGFDFRFGIDVVDEPMMRVNLRNYRFISAKQTVSENPAYVTFLLSRSPVAVYVQMTEYSPGARSIEGGEPALKPPETLVEPAEVAGQIGPVSLVLEGLEFETGSAELGNDPTGSLSKLADLLKQDPDVKVLLVGHSDMSGSVEANIAISTKRADSVRRALIRDHGIDAGRLSAHGVGFLSPRADNATEAGRQKNRRVEAVFSR
ncbi:OmpA family protein [Neptunicoccus cionae]|uniref:Membrane protein n=1 Tax=Neptunicoccus cionae TaxID=2035344 RepID=A0A916VQ63_9RHOB|nr:OmpA family protein [Amylibacter cionae]GGA18601.1 membrane protein [Amylibacter cionae]